MPNSIIVMCGEVKQCRVRCSEWMRVRSTASICALVTKQRRFSVAKLRTQDCHMRKRTQGLDRMPLSVAEESYLSL